MPATPGPGGSPIHHRGVLGGLSTWYRDRASCASALSAQRLRCPCPLQQLSADLGWHGQRRIGAASYGCDRIGPAAGPSLTCALPVLHTAPDAAVGLLAPGPMTYHEMRMLFERLAPCDGRLSVLMAGSQEPWMGWVVWLRDHVRAPWTCVWWFREFAAFVHGRGAADRPGPAESASRCPRGT
jgi:hypothetical protein